MKGLELVEYNSFAYHDVPDPQISEDEVLIRVQAVGICGSDAHGQDGSTGRRIPPVIMGHEAAGDVISAGSRVSDITVGMRVTFDSTLFCGTCFYCRRGEVNFCEQRRVLGVSADEYRQNGAFAEYVTVPARGVYPLPEDVGYLHAAMVEPLSIAVHAAGITEHAIGDTGVVVGAGMIGLLLVQVLRASGYGQVIAVDIDDRKLQLAAALGATRTVNSTTTDLGTVVAEETENRGVRNAFDAVGIQASFDSAIRSVRRGGTVTVIGNFAPSVEMPLQYLVTRQIRIQGSNASAGEYPACLELIRSGAVTLDPLISAVAPLSEGADWFRRLYKNTEGLIKVILVPDAVWQEGSSS
ncbi:MAG: galactitol-1-phosphate 5-dehydrogenase [Spirochaeta sp.]|jgi:L-iditol 2-dehydrogenase|nr:galactitol-1-phosphate 5-dehydrogenase [Spirochaeta sp.]